MGALLMNALYYTPEGGQIVVRTKSQRSNGMEWIGFSVKDTGLGISAEEQSRLFERFYRGKAARERGVPGTGLGLAMARQIVEQHGGRIEIASDGMPGKGTTFSVWLPVEEKENSRGLAGLAKRVKASG